MHGELVQEAKKKRQGDLEGDGGDLLGEEMKTGQHSE